jgi:nanoRNase/pAp phosphatase (c-di-AMP/oligoRNAs hydrolase)
LSRLFPEADIYAPGGLDRVARVVAERMGTAVLEECDLSAYDRVAIVDTSSPDQLETGQRIPDDAVVIDHHVPTGRWEGHPMLVDDSRVSCCEIVLELYDRLGAELPRDAGLMLLGGMYTDSGAFRFADPRLLRSFSDIMDRCGIHMDEVMSLTKAPDSISERVAVLKSMEDMRFERVGPCLVAVALAGSFESSVCRTFLEAGADVAFVASQRDETFRLSARAKQEIVRKGLNLGAILGDIGTETGTVGGGHEGAAGVSGTGDAEAMLHICKCRTMDFFRALKARDAL